MGFRIVEPPSPPLRNIFKLMKFLSDFVYLHISLSLPALRLHLKRSEIMRERNCMRGEIVVRLRPELDFLNISCSLSGHC